MILLKNRSPPKKKHPPKYIKCARAEVIVTDVTRDEMTNGDGGGGGLFMNCEE